VAAVERNDQSTLHPRGRLISDTLAAKWVELITQALLVLVVPRVLGAGPYGEFAVAFAIVSVLSLGLGLGAPLAAVRYLPAADPAVRAQQARSLAAAVARSRALTLGALSVAALALTPVLLDIPIWVTAAVCVAAAASVGSSIVAELALALNRTRVWNARFPLENGLVVAAAPLGYEAAGAHGAIGGLLVACVLAFALLLGRMLGALRGPEGGGPLPPEAMRYARLQTGTVALGTLIKRAGPIAMPLVGASSVQTGFAALATGFGSAGNTTLMSLLIVHLPGLVGRPRAESDVEAAHTFRVALAVGTVAAVVAALLAEPGIDLFLGDEFAGARDAVVLALPAVPLGAALGLVSLMAALRLRPGALTSSWAVGAIVFAILAAVAIPPLDAEGASIAMTGGLLAAAVSGSVLLGERQVVLSCAAAVAGAAMALAAGLLAA
jgi:O-antigen/teichoic acid export membrane protein